MKNALALVVLCNCLALILTGCTGQVDENMIRPAHESVPFDQREYARSQKWCGQPIDGAGVYYDQDCYPQVRLK